VRFDIVDLSQSIIRTGNRLLHCDVNGADSVILDSVRRHRGLVMSIRSGSPTPSLRRSVPGTLPNWMLHESVASREEWCRRGAALLLPHSHFALGIPVYLAIIGRRQALDPRCREGGADRADFLDDCLYFRSSASHAQDTRRRTAR
jgi:hypothetical protein